jgi:hypothetical protein
MRLYERWAECAAARKEFESELDSRLRPFQEALLKKSPFKTIYEYIERTAEDDSGVLLALMDNYDYPPSQTNEVPFLLTWSDLELGECEAQNWADLCWRREKEHGDAIRSESEKKRRAEKQRELERLKKELGET